jgi:hypothetical protein
MQHGNITVDTCIDGHIYEFSSATGYLQAVQFQTGPVPANGVNGLTSESVLVMLIDRTKFLNSQFPCPENEIAIKAMETALAAFDLRTAMRTLRGVEGTNQA